MTTLIRGRQREPINWFIYSPPGMGKTSFMAGAPNALVVGPENNEDFDGLKIKTNTFQEFMKVLHDVNKGVYKKEGIQILAIDTIDTVEGLICAEIIAKEPGKTMETAAKGYGKAWALDKVELLKVREVLKQIRAQGIGLVFLCHAIKRIFPDPILQMDTMSWEPSLHRGKNDDFNQIFLEWCSGVFFINNKSYKDDPDNAKFAVSNGDRELLTEFRPSHVAKNRYNLPYSIPLSKNIYENWPKLMSMVDSFYSKGEKANMEKQELAAAIGAFKQEMAKVQDQTLWPAMEAAFLENQNNIENLKVLINRVREITANQ